MEISKGTTDHLFRSQSRTNFSNLLFLRPQITSLIIWLINQFFAEIICYIIKNISKRLYYYKLKHVIFLTFSQLKQIIFQKYHVQFFLIK